MNQTTNRFAVRLAMSVATTLSASAIQADIMHMPAGQTSLQFVAVRDPGNSPSIYGLGLGLGAVNYTYAIGKYDVTAAQYAAFLNSVAAADPYGLYTTNMASGSAACGISRGGVSGSYSYSVAPGHANFPVNYISWGNAARFCNWVQNGQPTGSEGPGTTETGAYALNGAIDRIALSAVVRNASAQYVIPSDNEWFKAAYYKGGGTHAGYWLYPTQSNTEPSNTLPDMGNNANYNYAESTGTFHYVDPINLLTPVGTFTASPGPYGTFDQGGDVNQWTETDEDGASRNARGGSFGDSSGFMAATFNTGGYPTNENSTFGFRVASVPEPDSICLLTVGAIGILTWGLCRGRAQS